MDYIIGTVPFKRDRDVCGFEEYKHIPNVSLRHLLKSEYNISHSEFWRKLCKGAIKRNGNVIEANVQFTPGIDEYRFGKKIYFYVWNNKYQHTIKDYIDYYIVEPIKEYLGAA